MASPIASTSKLPISDDHASTSQRIRSGNEDTAPLPALRRLPPELIPTILSHVPPRLRTRTALALGAVLPDYPVPQRQVYEHVVVARAAQIMPLWRKMKDDEAGAGMVRTFALESWRGDADILNNALRCLPRLDTMMLNLGTNFAPEHLEEMFERPRPAVRRLEMRFRPYVSQATYYTFLKGSYFDTAIETLARRWPAVPSFTHLSIIQDPPPRSSEPPTAFTSTANSLASSIADLSLDQPGPTAQEGDSSSDEEASGTSTPPTSTDADPQLSTLNKGYSGNGPFPYLTEKLQWTKPKSFAQPIVFFDIKCLARFGASPVAAHLTHLRLRVPSRELAYVLIQRPMFPNLTYLDISTTNLRLDTTLAGLLKMYWKLEHLVIDRVNLFGFAARDKGAELCEDLSGIILSACLARGKEKERQIAAWDLGDRTRAAEAEAAQREEAARRLAARAARQQAAREDGAESGEDAEPELPEDEDEGTDEEEAVDAAAVQARLEAEAAEMERQRLLAVARSRRGHRSAAQSTFSLRDRPRRGAASTAIAAPTIPVPPPDRLYMVLPPLPALKSVSIGGEAHGVSSLKVKYWDESFHHGWKSGLEKLLHWATLTAERYERARRKADEWVRTEVQLAQQGKGKAKKQTGTRPPTDVRLYRFPFPGEVVETPSSDSTSCTTAPWAGLVRVIEDDRAYLAMYQDAIGDVELYLSGQGLAPCVLCTVPDCEGPARRGAEGERVDGRGGMNGVHRPGCGHMVGRRIWGWEGVE